MKRFSWPFLLFLVLAAAGGMLYVRMQLRIPGPLHPPREGLILEIPHGLGAREVVRMLADNDVISGRYVALAYIFYTHAYNRLQAGEYLFDRSLTIPEVVNKLTSGAVLLHKFTVPEGLTVTDIAQKWQEQGFGEAEDFLKAASQSIDLVQRFDVKATSVEGYLFPETYSFRSHTTSRQAVEAMVNQFGSVSERLRQTVPVANWPLNLRDTVILASLIESEAAQADERPVIASVYLNRLDRKVLLQCDPTVIYALRQVDKYRGTLTLADLRFNSPYNTYLKPGLPPGPIANPGYPSLLAAVQPAMTKYFFFVRTSEGRHAFNVDLAGHNRAVAAYRKFLKTKKTFPAVTGQAHSAG